MSQAEYIAVLWRIIGCEAVIIAAFAAVIWKHILDDRKTRTEVQRLKDAVGLNGGRG